jgi:aminoglycoside phosphotransferase (APT) family kinase protein
MTRLPGIPLYEGITFMTYTDRSQLAHDLHACISQFRQIPNFNDSAICNASGGPIFDPRLGHPKLAGPFKSEADFNKHIIKQDRLKSQTHDRHHNICFSHADLSPSNILVENGVLSGLVDFGCAGFYPEYWEYTKGHFTYFGPDTSWIDLLSEAFGGAYSEELQAEQKLWAAI